MNKEELIQFLQANKIWAKKNMGQNFLVDDEVLAKIVEAADLKSTDTVIEIGPGLGVLTEELVSRAGRVVAIEKDDFLAELLNQISNIKNPRRVSYRKKNDKVKIKIVNEDALDLDLSAYSLQLTAYDYKVVANIPYNITSAIIRKFLEADNKPELMVLLVQKEVAERIVARPGEMSLLSVSVQFYADVEIVDIVKSTSFFPLPKVESAIIKLKTKSEKRKVKEADLFRIVKFGFASRRKTLENNLAAGLHISKTEASDIIKSAGLSEKIRAQELTIEDWLKLYNVVNSKIKN
ncbi:MAG: 16S rRNA (adenine(1518)-N(6)/adenine(1519)-N(6))-dimethyltransferase RsmA [Candidatus Berkelbacteria bacterium]|nr:16S rRNA (adenine(1518)-N(6)/adenine(1519)-N(6))-dimethyltransferase RsmA [Candidatus Berkelbacteria bacterium]